MRCDRCGKTHCDLTYKRALDKLLCDECIEKIREANENFVKVINQGE